MLHPSYTDLMRAVNGDIEEGDTPVVNSRYSIVLATAKRARQVIAGEMPLVDGEGKKPLSIAVEELYKGQIKIMSDEETKIEPEEFPEEEAEDAAGQFGECL